MPEIQTLKIKDIISDIKRGYIKIPQFQRDFIWDKKKSASLIDSIIKGYPIGTFIIWKSNISLRTVRNIGNIKLPETPNGDFVQYVLDGQQRITSIFASILGEKVKRESTYEDFSQIYVDLAASKDGEIVYSISKGPNKENYINLETLVFGNLQTLTSYNSKYHAKIQNYRSNIETYPIPIIQIKDIPIDIATEIFTRINVGGKALTIFEIMVAKTFSSEKNFDLSEKYKTFRDRLESVGYGTISSAILLRSISVALLEECKKKQILSIKKERFIEIYPDVINSLELAIDYLKQQFTIPVSDLLPYQDLLVLFSYFFFIHPSKPSIEQTNYLTDLFWRISLTERYTSGTDSKIAQDIKRIKTIANYQLPKYDYSPIQYISKEYIEQNGKFNVSHSYIKAILCILVEQQPRSFDNNSIVNIHNNALKRGNSKNYHHFFPKAFLKKIKVDEYKINHVANITLVDDYLNKRIIGQKSPSVYIKNFIKNPKLKETLQTHLIDLDSDGILQDDFENFFNSRIKRISNQLSFKIIRQDIDIVTKENGNRIIKKNAEYVFTEAGYKINGANEKYVISYKGGKAYGIKENESIIILKDSQATVKVLASLKNYLLNLRNDLLKRGVLINSGDYLIFTKNYKFDSFSAAASIICGSSRNGRKDFTKI